MKCNLPEIEKYSGPLLFLYRQNRVYYTLNTTFFKTCCWGQAALLKGSASNCKGL